MKQPKKDRVPLLVDTEQYTAMRAYAEATGQSVPAVAREVVARFLAKHRDRGPNPDSPIRQLLNELPELLADYEHLAPDADGNIDSHRKKRIERFGILLRKLRSVEMVKERENA